MGWWWWKVLISPARMRQWLLQANIYLSILILLPGSQQHHFSWAPAVTFGMLLSWGLSGISLMFIHSQYFLENPRQVVTYTLKIWLPFVMALQSSLAEAVLLLPLSTTTAMIYLSASQSRQSIELQELPGPVPGPRRMR
ncbi:hypothetical protein HDV62DRAFT_373565 [Trichoderma sp. SZMC 28011]